MTPHDIMGFARTLWGEPNLQHMHGVERVPHRLPELLRADLDARVTVFGGIDA
jgi:hypothetical protein